MNNDGKGGGKTRIIDYFVSAHMGICHGPVDSVNKIFYNEKLISGLSNNGSSNTTSTLIDLPEFQGGTEKEGGIKGWVDIYLGGEEQKLTWGSAQLLGGTPDTVPGFRGIASVFFRGVNAQQGFWIGSNVPYIRTFWMEVTRYPEGPDGKVPMPNGQANPADIIFEACVNQAWGAGMPETMLDIESFRNCAELFRRENFGLSLTWVRPTNFEAFIGEILDHVQATLTFHPPTGLMRLKALRNDYDRNSLPVIHPGNAKFISMERKLWGETSNEVQVTWTNPENEEEETFTVQDQSVITIQGSPLSTPRNYYAIRSATLAKTVGERDIRQLSSSLLTFKLEVDRRQWDVAAGDVVDLRWPTKGVSQAYMRVTGVDYGRPNQSKIVLDLMEDVFAKGDSKFASLPSNTMAPPPPPGVPPAGDPTDYTVPVYPPAVPPYDPTLPITDTDLVGDEIIEWVDHREPPRALDHLMILDSPYLTHALTNGDTPEALVYPTQRTTILASQGGEDTHRIMVWTPVTDMNGNSELTATTYLANQFRAELSAPLAREVISADIDPLVNITGDYTPGGSNWVAIIGTAERFEYCSVEAYSDTTGIFTLRRGVLDTVPLDWPAGTPIWMFPILSVSEDFTARADGMITDYRFTPRTSLGRLDPTSVALVTHESGARSHLPSRPANVRINGILLSPYTVPASGNLEITWSNRNRTTETSQVLRWDDVGVVPEDGQTTSIILRRTNNTVFHQIDGLLGQSYELDLGDLDLEDLPAGENELIVELRAERDGFMSLTGAQQLINVSSRRRGWGRAWGRNWG